MNRQDLRLLAALAGNVVEYVINDATRAAAIIDRVRFLYTGGSPQREMGDVYGVIVLSGCAGRARVTGIRQFREDVRQPLDTGTTRRPGGLFAVARYERGLGDAAAGKATHLEHSAQIWAMS